MGPIRGVEPLCCCSAHSTCSRTKLEESSRRACKASVTAKDDGALPRPTARLRSHCSWPIRRIGLPASRVSKRSLFQPKSSTKETSSNPFRTAKSPSSVTAANLFQGQISWQSSQPYTRLPIRGRSSIGMLPLCSIVR